MPPPFALSPALQTPLCWAPEIPLLLSVPCTQEGRERKPSAVLTAQAVGRRWRHETSAAGSRADHLEREGHPSHVPLPGGRRRGTGERKKREPVAREREAEIGRVSLGPMAAQREDTSISPRHPQRVDLGCHHR